MNGKQLKNSILQWAIQGKLVPQNPKDEPASKLLERIAAQRIIASGAKQSKKTPASRLPAGRQCIYREGSSWFEESKDTQGLPAGRRDITEEIPFDIPESWEWCRLDRLVSLLSDGIHGTPEYDPCGEYFFVNGNNLKDCKIIIKDSTKRVNFSEYEKYKKTLNENSILVSINGTIGNIGYYDNEPIILGKSACYFNLLLNELKAYVTVCLKSDYFLRYAVENATGSTIKNVSLKTMNDFLISLPPLEEQKRIVKKLEQILPLVDEYDQAQTQLYKLNKELPETLKKSILQQAIQGKLVPPACRLAGRTQNLPGFEKGKWYTYVIECEDGSFYKGHTSNLSNRFKEHCAGKGADWTASHKPKQVYYYEVHYGEEEAISREKYLKSGAGREWFQKEVVNSPENWESAQKLLERIIATRNGCSTNQGSILSEAQSAKSKNPAKKKSKNETSRIYRDTDGLWYEQTGSSEPVNISEEIPFEIPETWTWCRLENLGTFVRGSGIKRDETVLEGRPCVRYGEMYTTYKVKFSVVKSFTRDDIFEKCQKIVQNDILMALTGENKWDIALAAVYQGIEELALGGDLCKFTPIECNPLYLVYLINSPYGIEYKRNTSTGDIIVHTSVGKLGNFLVPLPPLAEQKRIVAKLEQLFKAL